MGTTEKKEKYYFVTSGNKYNEERNPLQYYGVSMHRYSNIKECIKDLRQCAPNGEFKSGDYGVINKYIDGDVEVKKIITLKK